MAVTLRIDLTQGEQSIANNTTKVRARVYATSTSGSYNNSNQPGWLKLNEVKYTFNHSFSANKTTLLYDTTRTITHNSDGNKTVSATASFTTGVSSGTISASKSLPLTKINRRSQINNSSSFDLTLGTTLNITKYVSNYTDRLKVYLGSTLIKTINDVKNKDKLSFTDAELDTIYRLTPNAKFIEFKLELTTFNGSSSVGSTTAKTIGFISNSNPTILEVITNDSNTITTEQTGNNQKYVRGYSTLHCYIKAVAQKYAKISHFVIDGNTVNATYDEANDYYFAELSIEGIIKDSFEVFAVDTRTFTATQLITPDYIEYFKVSKGNQDINRLDDVGEEVTIEFSGSYWNGSFKENNPNILNASYKYKKTSDTNWVTGETPLNLNLTNNNFSFSSNIKGDTNAGFDINFSYDIIVTVADNLDNVEYKFQLRAGIPAIALFGNKVAIGDKYDENLGGLQLYGDKLFWNKENLFDTTEAKVLWSGSSYMDGSQTASLSERVTKQKSGIVLHFSAYADGEKQNYDHVYAFIPKHHVIYNSGGGVFTFLTTSKLATVGTKYIYVEDSILRGNTNNTGSGKVGGLSYNNSHWVLSDVYGV